MMWQESGRRAAVHLDLFGTVYSSFNFTCFMQFILLLIYNLTRERSEHDVSRIWAWRDGMT